ncbi:MAG: virulence-associated E family protein, partial [Oscillospiraceae bacterium]|nr:virulence-associated E family protein [Oscillospiraceae bacterium]
MQHDRLITITSAGNRWSKNWQPQQMLLSELWERLRTPVRSSEKLSDYLSMKKAQQDELKDVGGYVGGTLNSPRRKSANVTGRDIITLDFDNISANGTENVLQRIAGLGVGYCVYSTRKHHAGAPRLRVLIPLDRTVSVEEYEPCARKMAEYIGLEMADPSTFEVARLMYWPSCCSDSQYVYHWADSPFVSADGLLALYEDWQDMSKWPALPGTQTFTKLATKQGDPVDKAGIVGAFCRVYDVERAMLELLVGIYEPVDTMPGRYTYLGGSTAGGAVLYDDGKFLFSHHATDPCGGKLVNAFDLVRLHKFSDLDDSDGVKDGTKGNRLPSFTAMCQYAVSLSEVSNQMAADDFADLSSVDDSYSEPHNTDWTKHLTRDDTGALHKTIANITLLVQNIPELNGCARKDDFTGRFYTADNLPWRTEKGYWSDSDTTELRRYFETKLKRYKPGKQDIKDAVVAVAINQSFHPVQNYLNSLSWDGVERLDTLFMDYLGAADSEYGRAVARKALCGAVARVMTPGCKFDYMPLLIGGQGRGKSSLIAKLAGITDWF